MNSEEPVSRTEIPEIGEKGLVKNICELLDVRNSATVKAAGDDAAVIDYAGKRTLAATELSVEGVHFDLMYFPLHHLGYKLVTAAVSKIIAMNAKPSHILVSLGLSNKISVEMVTQIYEGINIACEDYDIDIAGGDTSASGKGLVINITALGCADEKDITYRDGAKENDLICVSGDLGAAYLGLQILEREKQIHIQNPEVQPKLDGYDYVLKRYLRPQARVDVPDILAGIGIKPTAMIEVSDGIASELLHICVDSNKGCKIYQDKLPFDPSVQETAMELNLDTANCILNGGGDYEILFTISQKDFDKIDKNPDISVIGHIASKSDGVKFVTASSNEHDLNSPAWEKLLNNG